MVLVRRMKCSVHDNNLVIHTWLHAMVSFMTDFHIVVILRRQLLLSLNASIQLFE